MHGYPQFQLDKEEWHQVDYLLCITQPFFKFTTALSKSKDITIHLIFSIYNKLFSHLEASEEQLHQKSTPWKKIMLQALQASREKLSEYYKMTDYKCYGDIYAIIMILAPSKKLCFFKTKDCQGDIDYARQYCGRLEEEFWRYKRQLSDNNSSPLPRASAGLLNTVDEIEMLCDSQNILQPEEPQGNNDDKLDRYLAKGKLLPLYKESSSS
jgi:ribosomal protein S15P/S13E